MGPVCNRVRTHRTAGHRVVVVAADAAVSAGAWSLLRAGASDVVPWGAAESVAARLHARLARWEEVDRMLAAPLVKSRLVGESPAWQGALRRAVEVARYSEADVLLTGETGTGKELVARLLHTLDRRPDKGDLVVLDCTTVSPELSGSEFYGHVKGAFTSAVGSRRGAFAQADGGTLFLDEVGELPLRLQAGLLRAIQEKTFKPVGGSTWESVRFRLVCATHRDLQADVAAGRFRQDLYHRIAAVHIRLPALRERPGDVPVLAMAFAREALSDGAAFDPPVLERLAARAYPGNVRELRQLVARIVALHVGDGPITVGDVPPDERPAIDDGEVPILASASDPFEAAARHALALGMGLKDISSAAGDAALRVALAEGDGTSAAAERLGVTNRAVQLRVAKWREGSGDGV